MQGNFIGYLLHGIFPESHSDKINSLMCAPVILDSIFTWGKQHLLSFKYLIP